MGTGPKDGLDPSRVLPSSCFMGGVGTCFLVFKLNKSFDPMDGARDSVRLTLGVGELCCLLPGFAATHRSKRCGYGGGFCSPCLGSAPRGNGPGVL